MVEQAFNKHDADFLLSPFLLTNDSHLDTFRWSLHSQNCPEDLSTLLSEQELHNRKYQENAR